MIKAVIFDMDGLFFDSEPVHEKAWNKIAERHGTKFTHEEYMSLVGRPAEEFAQHVINTGDTDKSVAEIFEEKRGLMPNLAREVEIRKGALELLKELKKNYTVGLASNSSRLTLEAFLKATSTAELFDFTVSKDDVDSGKPAPDIYLKSTGKARAKPEECVALEDSPSGALSAKTAGMKCIAIPNEYTRDGDFAHADKVVESFEEAEKIIENFNLN